MKAENVRMMKRYRSVCRNKGLTEKSIEAGQGDIGLFLRFVEQRLGDKLLEAITHIDVEDYFSYCQEERKNEAVTISRKYASLNSFFKTMIRKEYLDMKNPLDKIDKIKTRKKLRGHLKKWEVDRILEYLDEQEDLRGAAIVSLFFSSGCRLSEVHQLDKHSLDFKTRRFVVLGKGEKERVCAFSKSTAKRVQDYLRTRTDNFVPLFLSSQKKRWSKKAIQDFVKATGKRAGITKNVHPHIFRHSRAMHLLKKGARLELIQIQLGHSNISTTQIYAHQTMVDVQDKIDAIDDMD